MGLWRYHFIPILFLTPPKVSTVGTFPRLLFIWFPPSPPYLLSSVAVALYPSHLPMDIISSLSFHAFSTTLSHFVPACHSVIVFHTAISTKARNPLLGIDYAVSISSYLCFKSHFEFCSEVCMSRRFRSSSTSSELLTSALFPSASPAPGALPAFLLQYISKLRYYDVDENTILHRGVDLRFSLRVTSILPICASPFSSSFTTMGIPTTIPLIFYRGKTSYYHNNCISAFFI